MTKQYKIFLAISVLAILGLSVWGLFFNYGHVVINSEVSTFTVSYNSKTVQCTKSCDLKLKPGSYNLRIKSQGYTSMEYTAYLLKNEKETIMYAPLKQLKLDPVLETYTEPSQPRLTTSAGVQQLLVDSEVITTFKNPLLDTKVILSPTKKSAFIYTESEIVSPSQTDPSANLLTNTEAAVNIIENQSSNDAPVPEYYFVDVTKKSKQKINLEFSSPQNFILVSDTHIVFEADSKVIYFDLTKSTYTTLQVSSANHVLDLGEDQLIVLTSRSLDQAKPLATASVKQLTDLTDLTQEVDTVPDKIYLYDSNTSSYSFLQELDKSLESPFEFKTVLINQKLETVLFSNEKVYAISK
jgi:hypothetical protein